MKWFLIAVIHFYRRLPSFFKRKCLFKENCSSYVLRMTGESGFWVGVRTLRGRMLRCRPGYRISFDGTVKHWVVRFANGSVANRSELADFVLAPYLSLPVHVNGELLRSSQLTRVTHEIVGFDRDRARSSCQIIRYAIHKLH
jgi:putative component of membrane protein insertase Oxa1/YidC/SpoIIIJ protein YidD